MDLLQGIRGRVLGWLKTVKFIYRLMATGKKNRIQRSVWVEKIYYDILKEYNINISDLINYLLEFYLKEVGYLKIREHIEN